MTSGQFRTLAMFSGVVSCPVALQPSSWNQLDGGGHSAVHLNFWPVLIELEIVDSCLVLT